MFMCFPGEPEQISDVAKAEEAHIVSPAADNLLLIDMPIRSRYRRGRCFQLKGGEAVSLEQRGPLLGETIRNNIHDQSH